MEGIGQVHTSAVLIPGKRASSKIQLYSCMGPRTGLERAEYLKSSRLCKELKMCSATTQSVATSLY